MIPIPQDFQDFIQLLNQKRVKYLIVGGYAVAYYGYPRYTGDIDFFVAVSPQNAQKLVEVFKAFGFSNPPPDSKLFQLRGSVVKIGREPMRLEILNEIDGVSFDECYVQRVRSKIGTLRVNFIDLDSLKKNKKASARPKDLEDLEKL